MPTDADFDLTDPCSPPPRYNVLHDPHLKEYFQNPAMRRRLVEKGTLRLVFTSDGVVVGVVIRRVERYDLVKTKPTESEAEH